MLRSWMCFLLSCFAAVLLELYFPEQGIGLTVLYALLMLFALSLITAITAPFMITVGEQVGQDVIFKNEDLSYSARVSNSGFFYYPRVQLVFSHNGLIAYSDVTEVASIGPKGSILQRCSVHFPHRGVYEVGVSRIIISDFLGLFRIKILTKNRLAVTVYPESDEGFALSIRNEPKNSVLNSDQFNEDYTSVADVRKYSDSDNLRKIHWKLSAKRGELLVKNFQLFEPNRTILLLDIKTIPLTGLAKAAFEDKMISYTASAINHCLRGRLPSDFIYGETEAEQLPVDYAEDLGGVFRLLAEINFNAAKSTVYSANRITGAYNMVIFLADMDEGLHDAVRDLISFDHNVILYYFYSGELPLTEEKSFLLESLGAYGAGVNTVEIAQGRGEPHDPEEPNQ